MEVKLANWADDAVVFSHKVSELLNIGSIRMNILMLDTCNVEQTKDVRMYIEEFILVDIWIHCCTKLK